MWRPHRTAETVEDVPAPDSHKENLLWLGIGLSTSGILTLICGGLVAHTAGAIVEDTNIPAPIVGGLFMAAATSLPELVTCIAAVRRGALTLAVSDIVGGNFFDVLFVAAADIVYFQGSLFHGQGIGMPEVFMTCVTILLNVVLLSGLIYRQQHGPGNIGFESVLMLVIYVVGFLTLSFMV
jgi:cation:H+ antiporter